MKRECSCGEDLTVMGRAHCTKHHRNFVLLNGAECPECARERSAEFEARLKPLMEEIKRVEQKEIESLRASAAEKEEETERQAARIAELWNALNYLYHDRTSTGIKIEELCSNTAQVLAEYTLLSTPTGAKERIEKAVWEEAAEIMEKEGNESASARMGALGEFCFEIAGDFRKRAEGET